jgi:hypothetical protein
VGRQLPKLKLQLRGEGTHPCNRRGRGTKRSKIRRIITRAGVDEWSNTQIGNLAQLTPSAGVSGSDSFAIDPVPLESEVTSLTLKPLTLGVT